MKKTLLRCLATTLAVVSLTTITRAQTPTPSPGAGAAPVPARGGGGFARGGPGAPADVPVPRNNPAQNNDPNSEQAHKDLLAKAKLGGIDIYFEGDSITRRWGTSDSAYKAMLENWNSNFFGWNAADFGWGADSLQHILWRLENGELDGVNPKIIVFLGGINNIGGPLSDDGIANVERGIKKNLEVMQEKAPNAIIILTAIFPRDSATATIKKIDEDIAKFADGKKIRFLNVNDKLAGPDGKQLPGMFVDGTHPTPKGYQVWADGLKPIFTEILGPPAKTDHAPPPSKDPGIPAPRRGGRRAGAGGPPPGVPGAPAAPPAPAPAQQ